MTQDTKIISFINLKGGVGKTSTAINVADELANSKRVLIIDMDPQFNATQALLSHQLSHHKEKIPTVLFEQAKRDFEANYKKILEKKEITEGGNDEDSDSYIDIDKVKLEINSQIIYKQLKEMKMTARTLFTKENIVNEIGKPSLIYNIKNNLDLIPGDLDLFEFLNGDTSGKHNILEDHFEKYNIRGDYEYIIIDCPPNWTILTQASLFASDYYIVPSKIDLFSSVGIGLLINLVDSTFYSRDSGVYTFYSMFRNKIEKEPIKPLGVLFTLTHETTISKTLKQDLKDNIHQMNFLESEIPYQSSVPLKFSLYSEVGEKHKSLTNALEKVTIEISDLINSKEGAVN